MLHIDTFATSLRFDQNSERTGKQHGSSACLYVNTVVLDCDNERGTVQYGH